MNKKMKVNTLVTHKKLKSLGIGCVSKVLKNSVRVNFGLEDTMTCKLSVLEAVDDKNFSTIKYNVFRDRIFQTEGINNCIVGNELKEFVGIGWITLRVINKEDLQKYPRVID